MTTCRERYQKIIAIIRQCTLFIGADILDPNYRINFFTYLLLLTGVFYYSCTGYTVYMLVYVQKDWKVMLEALCVIGTSVQGFSKLYSAIAFRHNYLFLDSTLNEIYIEYEQKRKGYKTVLNNSTDLITKILKATAILYIILSIIVCLFPVAYKVLYNKKILVMQFLIPGIDAKTDYGYTILAGIHVLLILCGMFGNFAGDTFFFITVTQTRMLKDLLKLKFEDLNEIAATTKDPHQISEMLIDTVKWHQKYISYTAAIKDTFFFVIFMQVLTCVFGICLSLFISTLGTWPASGFYATYSFIILYTYCGLGTLVEIANDDVCEIIYNDCIWYVLPVREQKVLLIMLMNAQNPTMLTVGNIMPLSVATALQVTKTIYTYMMMLMNFAED